MSGIVLLNHLQHAFLGVFHHRFARMVAVGLSGAGKQQTKEVVNLGGSAYGGARVAVGGLLLNADNRTEARNLVNVRPFQSTEEVAGVGRERLDVTPLTFSKDGVEGK